jgi:hypothetical protein
MTKQKAEVFNQANVYTGKSSNGYGNTYYAKRDFKTGEKIMLGFGRITDHQTSHSSVQIGPKKHYVPTKWTGKYWNHSCNPNCYMKTGPETFPELFAAKPIKKGEEISYPYWMTEYEWSSKAKENFVSCLCGSGNCKGKILSFSQLPEKQREVLKQKGQISKYLMLIAIVRIDE